MADLGPEHPELLREEGSETMYLLKSDITFLKDWERMVIGNIGNMRD